jgi:site-specific DNA-methyltransferase (adenine-specific)
MVDDSILQGGAMMVELDRIICGDCLEEQKKLPDKSIDAIVTDPPYELAFMGKKWDASGIAYNVDMWGECLRVLKPGGHLLAFGGARTYHRMACAIEDAGFEIRDSLHWVYGSGFPKSLSIGKALDKMAGAEREVIGFGTNGMGRMNQNNAKAGYRPNPYSDGIDGVPITAPASDLAKQWSGWGSALKPAHEPIVLARKPMDGCTIAENVLRWGCGGLNVDGCRICTKEDTRRASSGFYGTGECFHNSDAYKFNAIENKPQPTGRFPANLIHDGSEVVLAEFAKAGESKSQRSMRGLAGRHDPGQGPEHNRIKPYSNSVRGHDDEGSPARFFQSCPFTEEDIPAFLYYAKASRAEREKGLEGMPISDKRSQYGDGLNSATKIRTEKQSVDGVDRGVIHNGHPTVKPLALMRTLCRLITPPGGLILDPFAGSGTTCMAAKSEGFHYVGIELSPEYCEIARKRVAAVPRRLDSFFPRQPEEDARQ